MSNNKQLSVRLQSIPVGVLTQNTTGKMSFAYTNPSARSISFSMPVHAQTYNNAQCEAYFGGLLPESEWVKKAIGKYYGVSANNTFALLKAVGYDCAGAISFHEMDEPINLQSVFPLTGKVISANELYEHIKALPQKPLFLGFEGLRLSLAGVQDKAAICLIDGQIALPINGCPTTHILKPAVANFAGIVENEYFCLRLAARLGLPVPKVEICQVKDISYLLIERYDRKIQNNQVERIHQEDFCQALGIVSMKKYQNEGGPGLKQCFELLNHVTRPAVDRNQLAAGIIFNFLIGNMDAHGKNFSLLHTTQSNLGLAPFYDMLCTRAYPDLTAKMAMKIGGKYEFDQVLPKHWQLFCEEINYSYPMLKRLIKQQGEIILKAAEAEKQHMLDIKRDIPIIKNITHFFEKHINQTVKQFL